MGLSGRKQKQRIGADPRNLAWADDAAKFGSSYLSKFGWDSSKGLGVEGEGRLSHIKVSQKLDMLGIGAAQQRDPNGIAWKQNKDFERLLERLNASTEAELKAEFVKEEEQDKPMAESVAVVATVEAVKPVVPRHRAHRARAIAAKNISSKSAVSISEILGIAPTATTGTPKSEGTLTPADDVPDEKITTSTKSVADYFKDKLLAKAGKSLATTSTVDVKTEMDYDAPRGGLGSSRVKLEVKEDSGDQTLSSTLVSSFFTAASTSAIVKEEEELHVDEVRMKKKKRSSTDAEDGEKRKDKKDKKGKRRQEEEQELTVASDSDKKKKKKRRRDEEPEPATATPEDEPEKKKKRRRQEADAEDAKEDVVDEDERKKAKKERKRLKALAKAEAITS